MSHFPVQVGRPLENRRTSRRGDWRWNSQAALRRKPRFDDRRDSARLEADCAPEIIPEPVVGALPLLPVRYFLLLSALLAVVILLIWGLVRANHLSVAFSYDISGLTAQKMELLETNRRLKTELAEIGSLGQLEEAASKTLGLIVPNQGQITVIE